MVAIKKNLVKDGIEKLAVALPKAFDSRVLVTTMEKLFPYTAPISDSTKYRIQNAVKKLPINWNKRTVLQLYTLVESAEAIDLLSAWTQRRWYLSHFSALYWNELVEQKPVEHYLSADLHHRLAPENVKPVNIGLVPMAFLKGHRQTQNFCTYKKMKFFFLERAASGEIGVISKSINLEASSLSIRLTSIERTLIDSVVSPQYSGGMPTVVKAFSIAESKLSIPELYRIYTNMNLSYPYWQTIGFILDQIQSTKSAQWAGFFEKPAIDFYYDRSATAEWKYSESWRLFYPKGLSKE